MPQPKTNPAPAIQVLTQIKVEESPHYDVILLDDDDHSYDYVIEMLGAVFGHSPKVAFDMACEVDAQGYVIVFTTHKDEAKEKQRAIESYGADWRMPECAGSMSAIIEPTGRL